VLGNLSDQNVMQIDQKKQSRHRAMTLIGLSLLIVSTLLSCRRTKQNTFDMLQGHWHMDSPYRMTLDISGSTVEVNKHSLFETPEQFQLFDSATNDIMLPIPCGCGGMTLPRVDKFSFRSDTLIYDDEIVALCYAYTPMKFVRGNLEACQWKHTIQGNSINVKLSAFPICTSSPVNLDSLRRTSLVSYINIGVPEHIEMFGRRPKIQVNDVFVEPTEIQQFIDSEKNRGGNLPLVLCLNVDNDVSRTFLETVLAAIPNDSVAAFYRLVTVQPEKKIYGYQKMWR
jgi:hypothetical protein